MARARCAAVGRAPLRRSAREDARGPAAGEQHRRRPAGVLRRRNDRSADQRPLAAPGGEGDFAHVGDAVQADEEADEGDRARAARRCVARRFAQSRRRSRANPCEAGAWRRRTESLGRQLRRTGGGVVRPPAHGRLCRCEGDRCALCDPFRAPERVGKAGVTAGVPQGCVLRRTVAARGGDRLIPEVGGSRSHQCACLRRAGPGVLLPRVLRRDRAAGSIQPDAPRGRRRAGAGPGSGRGARFDGAGQHPLRLRLGRRGEALRAGAGAEPEQRAGAPRLRALPPRDGARPRIGGGEPPSGGAGPGEPDADFVPRLAQPVRRTLRPGAEARRRGAAHDAELLGAGHPGLGGVRQGHARRGRGIDA